MAFWNSQAVAVPLTSQLDSTAASLREKSATSQSAAESYRQFADAAAASAQTAAVQALAVEKALAIVSDAGVTL